MKETSNYTEDAVSIAVGNQLSVLSFPFFKFSVEPISRSRERWIGADARLLGGRRFSPFYMQFKRPFAYSAPSRSKIIKDRDGLTPKLSTAPRTLFFSLQDKLQNHRDYQHNVLYRLRQKLLARKMGDAAYVCPLFLDRQRYYSRSHMAGLLKWVLHWPARPYDNRTVTITTIDGDTIALPNIPLFSEHISIPPHEKVDTATHKYSFTEKGEEVCFHSPESLPEGSFVFSEWLGERIASAISGNDILTLNNSGEQLMDLVAETLGDNVDDFEIPEDSSQAWFAWGDFLERRYAIEQYGVFIDEL